MTWADLWDLLGLASLAAFLLWLVYLALQVVFDL